jgi:hypothetical protein
VILTVNVVRYSAAKGHELGSGGDGKEPPFRNEYVENSGEAYAALCPKDSGAGIKGDEIGER